METTSASKTAASTPASSPGLYSPSPPPQRHLPSMGDSNPAVSPYLHPLQMHKVREYVLISIMCIVNFFVFYALASNKCISDRSRCHIVPFRSDIAYHFPSALLGGELPFSRLLTSLQDLQGASRAGFHYWPKAHQSIRDH